jgi:REP element-mobilizing transposase RayT
MTATRDAKQALQRPPVHLTGEQARSAAMGFKKAALEGGYRFFACAILPEHVHLVMGATARTPRRVIAHLKTRAIQQLVADSLWSGPDVPAWSRGCWVVYLDNDADLHRAIAYVEKNPSKEGKPRQRWSFVVQYKSN